MRVYRNFCDIANAIPRYSHESVVHPLQPPRSKAKDKETGLRRITEEKVCIMLHTRDRYMAAGYRKNSLILLITSYVVCMCPPHRNFETLVRWSGLDQRIRDFYYFTGTMRDMCAAWAELSPLQPPGLLSFSWKTAGKLHDPNFGGWFDSGVAVESLSTLRNPRNLTCQSFPDHLAIVSARSPPLL